MYLLGFENFLLLLLLLGLVHLHGVVQDGLHAEAVHSVDVWLDTVLVCPGNKVTVERLFHHEPKQLLAKDLLTNFHQLNETNYITEKLSLLCLLSDLGIVFHQGLHSTQGEDKVGPGNLRGLLAPVRRPAGENYSIHCCWLIGYRQ